MLPFSVGQGISRNIRRGPEKLWNTVFPDVLRSIGITEAGSGLKIVLCIVLIIAFRRLLSIIWKMLKKQMLECSEWIYLFFWISSILTMLCVAFTTMESSERYYFLVVFLLAEALAMEVGVKFKTEAMAGRIVTLVLLITAITTIYLPILKSAEPPQNEFNEVAKFLSDKEYRIAYATFENANTITALSDGNIRVAAVASVKDMSACKWLSSSAWYVPEVPYEERTAYVVTEAEREEFEEFLLQHEGELQLETQIGKFYIFSADYNFSKLDA